MMFYHYALAHVHALFDIHFFGEGGVKGVCVVNGKYKAVFACGHKIVFGFAESARDFSSTVCRREEFAPCFVRLPISSLSKHAQIATFCGLQDTRAAKVEYALVRLSILGEQRYSPFAPLLKGDVAGTT